MPSHSLHPLVMSGPARKQKGKNMPNDLGTAGAPPGSLHLAGSAFIAVTARLPEWKTDRECPGDTVSRCMVVLHVGASLIAADIACFHFPTGAWCWRETKWPVTHWAQLPNQR